MRRDSHVSRFVFVFAFASVVRGLRTYLPADHFPMNTPLSYSSLLVLRFANFLSASLSYRPSESISQNAKHSRNDCLPSLPTPRED
jgi:hypothetical protein